MPCYQINTMTVEFKAENVERLVSVLREKEFEVVTQNNRVYARSGSGRYDMIFDLTNAKVTVSGTTSYDPINEIKRAYSLKTVEEIAKKKRWAIRRNKAQAQRMQLVRY